MNINLLGCARPPLLYTLHVTTSFGSHQHIASRNDYLQQRLLWHGIIRSVFIVKSRGILYPINITILTKHIAIYYQNKEQGPYQITAYECMVT